MIGDLKRLLGASPFEPFTVVTSGGARYPVPTADHAGISPTMKRFVIWFDDGTSVVLSGLHITAIELGTTAAA